MPTPADAASFRRGMRSLGGGVTIVSSRHRTERSGLTATAVCSLSVTPARVLACVNVSGTTYRLIAGSRRMAVNILAKNQEHIARRFAGMTGAREDDPFNVGQWRDDGDAPPMLEGGIAAFDCVVNEMLVAHSHAILIGEIQKVVIGSSAPPLIYLDGEFTTTAAA